MPSELPKRTVIANIHIPKTGGSTFSDILRKNFDAHFKDGRGPLDTPQFSADRVEELLSYFPALMAYSDHKLSLDLPFSSPDFDVRAFVCVREPIGRLVSDYYFNRYHAHYDPLARQLCLDDYVLASLQPGGRGDNYQTRFLTPYRGTDRLKFIKEQISEHDVLIFTTRRFDELCVLLEETAPGLFRDCAYVIPNKSNRDDQQLSSEVEAKCNSANLDDRQLLRFAELELDRRLAEAGLTDSRLASRLASFKLRCQVLEQAERSMPVRILQRIARGADRIATRLSTRRAQSRFSRTCSRNAGILGDPCAQDNYKP